MVARRERRAPFSPSADARQGQPGGRKKARPIGSDLVFFPRPAQPRSSVRTSSSEEGKCHIPVCPFLLPSPCLAGKGRHGRPKVGEEETRIWLHPDAATPSLAPPQSVPRRTLIAVRTIAAMKRGDHSRAGAIRGPTTRLSDIATHPTEGTFTTDIPRRSSGHFTTDRARNGGWMSEGWRAGQEKKEGGENVGQTDVRTMSGESAAAREKEALPPTTPPSSDRQRRTTRVDRIATHGLMSRVKRPFPEPLREPRRLRERGPEKGAHVAATSTPLRLPRLDHIHAQIEAMRTSNNTLRHSTRGAAYTQMERKTWLGQRPGKEGETQAARKGSAKQGKVRWNVKRTSSQQHLIRIRMGRRNVDQERPATLQGEGTGGIRATAAMILERGLRWMSERTGKSAHPWQQPMSLTKGGPSRAKRIG